MKKCKQELVMPKSFLPRNLLNLDNRAFTDLDHTILNSYIKKKKLEVRNVFKNSENNKLLLRNCTTVEWWNIICNNIYTALRFQATKHQEILDRKLTILFEKSVWKTKSNPNLFENLSSYELGENEKLVLGFGITFCFARKNVNALSIAKGFVNLDKTKFDGLSTEDI